jgi:hypothetical protein
MKRTNLTGQRFGSWTAIIRDNSTKRGAARWSCRCDCGGAATVRADVLKSGASQSCGMCDVRRDLDLPRGALLARDLGRIERKQKLAAAIGQRLQGLGKAERLNELKRMAAEVAQARQAAR